MSVAGRIGLPEAFQTTLLVVALLLALAPHFAGLTIGGVQLPRIDHRRRRALKIFGPLALVAAIALVLPVEALAPPLSSRMQLVAADPTPAGEIDLAIVNSGKGEGLVTHIELEILSEGSTHARPVLAPSARYRIPIDDLRVGQRRGVVVRHVIAPATTERILVAPQTNRALTVRVHVRTFGDVVMTRDVELWLNR
ncbi:MAG TPA: hypothetical protein VEO74_08075 [Thermoanaerobaculia bacterium]|nr:hypothetical protein [Thermoanaerobaculia bacterium]